MADHSRDRASSDPPVRLVDDDLGVSLLDGGQDLSDTDDPVIPELVEEEGGRAARPAAQAALEVLANPVCVGMGTQLVTDPGHVKAEIGRVLDKMIPLERLLLLEKGRVHLEESTLDTRGFGDLGGLLRMGVRCSQGKWRNT